MLARSFVVAAVIAVALAVPTAAVTMGEDDAGTGGALTIAPSEGPNGEYATVEDGELRVDFDRLNDRATTRADDVVRIAANGSTAARVWVTVDADAGITVYDGSGQPIDSRAEAVELRSGEELSVGFEIDTRGSVPDEATITVHAEALDSTSGGGDGGDGGGTGGSAPGEPPAGPPDAPTSLVDLADGEVPSDAVSVTVLDELPADRGRSRPRAVISISGRVQGETVVRAGGPVRLLGWHSIVTAASGIDQQRRTGGVVDISTAERWRDEPATLRFRMDRDRLRGADPTAVRVGRLTDQGWQILPTRATESGEGTVTLETRTPGFSVFAVFLEPRVQYEWTLPNGTRIRGQEIQTRFDEPGRYNVSLTVTDAYSQTDTTRREVVVNDDPTVSIETPANVTRGEPTTLRANVTNDVGNATVTWTFADGTTATGTEVQHVFTAESEQVRVSVEDEYGATGRNETTVVTGATGGGSMTLSVSPLDASPAALGSIVGLAVVGVGIAVRSSLPGRLRTGGRSLAAALGSAVGGRPPRVEARNARWNPDARAVELDLRVDAVGGAVETVEIDVFDAEGTRVAGKTIDVDAGVGFAATGEQVWLFDGLTVGSGTVTVRAVGKAGSGSRRARASTEIGQSNPAAGV
ncbi:hypothetical protein BRC83_07090 [Halobacteriales archaeon QS_1_68_17]|nr:MAG: hypothetical protein BRC83_07090 [Halobacteriales archaeon QS_1_68_17]